MPAELQPATPQTPDQGASDRTLIERGADLVYLTEELYLRLFMLTLLLTVLGCAISIVFAAVGSHTSLRLTALIAALVCALAAFGLARPRRCYLWLRRNQLRQVSPAVIGIIAVLCNGPDSPSWWVALPLLWVVAAVSSTGLSLAAATVTAGAYLIGTLLGGEALIHSGDAEILAAAVALVANILIGRLVAEVFARFVLRLHQLEQQAAPSPSRPRPVRVTTVPTGTVPQDKPRPMSSPIRARRRRLSHLTSRELEALL
jgi:hypothetical protein